MSNRLKYLSQVVPSVIAGAGGGGKSGGSGEEQPDNLKSNQVAKVVDLISEGPCRGLINGMKSVFLDGVQLQRDSGVLNFKNVIMQEVLGWPNQPIMSGFAAQLNEQAVQTELKAGVPQVRTILNEDVDRCRVTIGVPSLQKINKKSGDITGTSVTFRIQVSYDGGSFSKIGDFTITGKTTSKYQRSYVFPLKKGPAPFDIQVTRLTADSTSNELQNDLTWDSYTEIIDDRVNYNLSACIGTQVSASQFNSIPRRSYEYEGILCLVPDNYDEDNGTYSGVWDGTFKMSWTNNPAWVLYDILINKRYGLGQYLTDDMLDKWAFYKAGVWCDGKVSNGRGGTERRWTCNVQVFDQYEAYDLIQQFASVFRGFTYWNGSQITPVADQPDSTIKLFTNANVIEGVFEYSSSDIRSRHTQINVGWRDPALLGQKRFATVEDFEAVSKYGIQPLDIEGFGITSESQAVRLGKWQLYTELYEAEAVTFGTGLDGTYVRPGDIISILDNHKRAARWGGRVGAGSTSNVIQVDSPITLNSGILYQINCIIGEGVVQTRSFTVSSTMDYTAIPIPNGFTEAPDADTIWTISQPNVLEPGLWRVVMIDQPEKDRMSIRAVRHYPDKWDYVEKNLPLDDPRISDIPIYYSAVQDVKLIEYLKALSSITIAVYVTLSWKSAALKFEVYWRKANTSDNWNKTTTEENAIDLLVSEGVWEFQITPISGIGARGTTFSFRREILGKFALPSTPKNFRISVVNGIASFGWDAAEEVDVAIGGSFELRHSGATSGATWFGAQTIIPSIPGTATSVEAPYRPGTWMLKMFDITGRSSVQAAMIISNQLDTNLTNFFRIEEDPTYMGDKSNTEILYPQEWLIIGASGGYWDSQLDNINDWPDVDNLPVPSGEEEPDPYGTYKFSNRIDMGGVFSVTFATDVLAFPYIDGGNDVDNRMLNVDDWPSWDDELGDLRGDVTIKVRQTPDDPASPLANWSDWSILTSGEYVNRGFEFMAVLSATIGQNIGIERLAITADVRNKIDSGEDVPYPAGLTRVYFSTKFYSVPAVVVTVQDAIATDQWQIVNKTREYFEIEIKNGGVQQTRTFDWQAQGY